MCTAALRFYTSAYQSGKRVSISVVSRNEYSVLCFLLLIEFVRKKKRQDFYASLLRFRAWRISFMTREISVWPTQCGYWYSLHCCYICFYALKLWSLKYFVRYIKNQIPWLFFAWVYSPSSSNTEVNLRSQSCNLFAMTCRGLLVLGLLSLLHEKLGGWNKEQSWWLYCILHVSYWFHQPCFYSPVEIQPRSTSVCRKKFAASGARHGFALFDFQGRDKGSDDLSVTRYDVHIYSFHLFRGEPERILICSNFIQSFR